MRLFITGFASCYLLIALCCGFAMKATMPALNLLGVAYVGIVSPVNFACAALTDFRDGPEPICWVGVPDDKTASWLFTFEKGPPHD